MHANVPEPSLERLCLAVTGVFNGTAANPTLANTRGRRGLAPWADYQRLAGIDGGTIAR